MKDKISKYLYEQHNPAAIILHGSRAVGAEREHSDWDFILLFDRKDTPGDFRELFEGENIEVQSVSLPIEDVLNVLDTKLQHAVVLNETNGEATQLIKDAKSIYEKGFQWPAGWPDGPQLWMIGRLEGMQDTVDSPEVFTRHFSQFYVRAINYWYQIRNREYSQPIYLALQDMEKRDPAFRSLIKKISEPGLSNEEKVDKAKLILKHLFN